MRKGGLAVRASHPFCFICLGFRVKGLGCRFKGFGLSGVGFEGFGSGLRQFGQFRVVWGGRGLMVEGLR